MLKKVMEFARVNTLEELLEIITGSVNGLCMGCDHFDECFEEVINENGDRDLECLVSNRQCAEKIAKDIRGIEPCTDCTFECYDDEITKEMISRGIDIGIITFTNSPDDGSVVCKIGEYWFYFCGTFEMSEYGTIEPLEDLSYYLDGTSKAQKVDDIYTTLEDMRKEGWECEDEYDYYYEYLKENL